VHAVATATAPAYLLLPPLRLRSHLLPGSPTTCLRLTPACCCRRSLLLPLPHYLLTAAIYFAWHIPHIPYGASPRHRMVRTVKTRLRRAALRRINAFKYERAGA